MFYLSLCLFLSATVFTTTATTFNCEPIQERDCFGKQLDYLYTTTELAEDSNSQEDVKKHLSDWYGLRFLPKCWQVLQPFLCDVYKPKCVNGSVKRPCRDQCLATRRPCSVVETFRKDEPGWPDFLNCDRFPANCNGTIKKVALGNESACSPPLVETDYRPSWFEGIQGCGIQCENPIFTKEEHTRIHRFVAAFGSLTVICTLFTMVTFLIGWKAQNRYPSAILFFMNSCFCVASLGFLLQFSKGARDIIVCRKDKTMRLGEPREGNSFLCLLSFIMVYYFSMAGAWWFVILSYSWFICFKSLGSTRDNFAGKTIYFHCIAWTIPLLLTVAILTLRQVDANSLSGICFVGYQNPNIRAGFLLATLGLDLFIGLTFIVRGLITLCKLRKSNPHFLNSRASAKIKETIIRVGMFSFMAFVLYFSTFACHMYEYYHQSAWEKSLKEFLHCIAKKTVNGKSWKYSSCKVMERPNIEVIELELSSLFGVGIAMSTWTWTSSMLRNWKRLWHKLTRRQIYPELSHYKIIRRMKRKQIGPAVLFPAEAGVACITVPKADAIRAAAHNQLPESRRTEQLKEDSLQLVTASCDFTAHEQTPEQNLQVNLAEKVKTHSKL